MLTEIIRIIDILISWAPGRPSRHWETWQPVDMMNHSSAQSWKQAQHHKKLISPDWTVKVDYPIIKTN